MPDDARPDSRATAPAGVDAMPAAFIGHGFTETLAIELGGDGIRANAIAPGAVAGERVHRVLLASDAAKSISGQTISIDGDSQAAE